MNREDYARRRNNYVAPFFVPGKLPGSLNLKHCLRSIETMKKLTIAIMVLTLLISLSSCGARGVSPAADGETRIVTDVWGREVDRKSVV